MVEFFCPRIKKKKLVEANLNLTQLVLQPTARTYCHTSSTFSYVVILVLFWGGRGSPIGDAPSSTSKYFCWFVGFCFFFKTLTTIWTSRQLFSTRAQDARCRGYLVICYWRTVCPCSAYSSIPCSKPVCTVSASWAIWVHESLFHYIQSCYTERLIKFNLYHGKPSSRFGVYATSW